MTLRGEGLRSWSPMDFSIAGNIEQQLGVRRRSGRDVKNHFCDDQLSREYAVDPSATAQWFMVGSSAVLGGNGCRAARRLRPPIRRVDKIVAVESLQEHQESTGRHRCARRAESERCK